MRSPCSGGSSRRLCRRCSLPSRRKDRSMASTFTSKSRNAAESLVREIFDAAEVGVEGKRPGDIVVKDPAFYGRLVRDSSLGLGESYMDEWWECEALDLFVEKI